MTANKRKPRHPLLGKLSRVFFGVLATLILVAVFYLAIILGQPDAPESQVVVDQTQPLLSSAPALRVNSADQLAELMDAFPVPVLCFQEGTGPTLREAVTYDQAFENGFGRIAQLTYEASGGDMEFTLTTIYPARAISLMGKGDFKLMGAATQTLNGMKAVRMEDASHIRLHAQADDALYVLTVPQISTDTLNLITRILTLHQAASAT